MCTGIDLIARVARARLPYEKRLVSGDLLGTCLDVCVRAVPACGVRGCGVGARQEPGQRHGCGEAVPDTAPRVGVVRWSGPPCSSAGTCGRCTGGRMGVWSTWCLPAVRGRVCVVAWAGAESGGSFGVFALVAVWGIVRLLHEGRILCGKVPNNAYSQDSQEFVASAGVY
jgi:hypothetical protein